MKAYSEMTVKELKEESKSRGLTLESKGHKFNKSELIARLSESNKESNKTESNVKETTEQCECGCEDESWDAPVLQKNREEVKQKETSKDNVVRIFRPENCCPDLTLDEIERKYSERRPEWVYEKELAVGSFVAFVHYVEAKDQNVYAKLRKAKVVAVNRKKELVRVETFFGDEVMLSFDRLLFICSCDSTKGFPVDINRYMRKQRTTKGREKLNERFEHRTN